MAGATVATRGGTGTKGPEKSSSCPRGSRPGPRTSDATATRAAEKGVGKDVDRERELRSGGTRATWRTCRNPGAPTRAVDPAGDNGSHHALLRPPTA